MTPLVEAYIVGRRRRGEIQENTAAQVRSRLYSLDDAFGRRPITSFGPKVIDRWLEEIGHLAPGTRRAHISAAHRFCRWLVAEKIIRTDPMLHVMPVRSPLAVPRALAPTQARALLLGVQDTRGRAVLQLMLMCGVRCCEISRLRVEDFDPRPGSASILVRGKGGHERLLPVPEPARRAVLAYLAEAGASGGPLVRSQTHPHEPVSPAVLSQQVSRWMRDTGIKRRARDGISAHALRHTAASDVLDKCHDVRVVQEMLGHMRLSTTAVYLRRASQAKLREAMEGRDYTRPSLAVVDEVS